MSSAFEKIKIKSFVSIAGCSDSIAIQYLKQTNWEVETALNNFYTNGPKAPQVSTSFLNNINKVYEQYKDPSQDEILIDGTLRYFEDLDIDPTQVTALIIALELQSPKLGEFTRDNFINGWTNLNCDTIHEMKAKIPELLTNYQDPSVFKKVYQFAFTYSLSQNQRSLGLETAIPLWEATLADKYTHLPVWFEYLQTKYNKSISKDTWNQFYDFIQSVQPDMTDYDQDGAWPYAIDEFVEFARQKLSLPTPSPSLA